MVFEYPKMCLTISTDKVNWKVFLQINVWLQIMIQEVGKCAVLTVEGAYLENPSKNSAEVLAVQ